MNEILIEQGKRFRTAREGLRLTQTDVARAISVNQVSISLFESGNRKKEFTKYIDFMVSRGIDKDWLEYGNAEVIDKAEMAGSLEGIDDLRNEISILKLEKKEHLIIIREQKNIINDFKDTFKEFTDLKHQVTSLTTSLNGLMTLVMASGMQLLPKQQIVGQQQQDFNTAGVSSQFLVANIMIEYYLKALKVG